MVFVLAAYGSLSLTHRYVTGRRRSTPPLDGNGARHQSRKRRDRQRHASHDGHCRCAYAARRGRATQVVSPGSFSCICSGSCAYSVWRSAVQFWCTAPSKRQPLTSEAGPLLHVRLFSLLLRVLPVVGLDTFLCVVGHLVLLVQCKVRIPEGFVEVVGLRD